MSSKIYSSIKGNSCHESIINLKKIETGAFVQE